MKIKAVCEMTGLSDRTIRYYIEQSLICPAYTENYLGRRTYDFQQKDIRELNDIAVLRKFDFTIEEIRDIINDAETSKTALYNVRNRTEKTVSDGQEKLSVLSKISTEKTYTLAELAEELSKPSLALPDHKESVEINIAKIIFSILKAIIVLLIVWLPIALSLFVVIISIHDFHYPVFSPQMVILTVVSFLPSIAVLVVSKTRWKWKKIAKRILLVFCIFSIPISFVMSFGIISGSETTDIRNYRKFDADCSANRNVVFQELFPSWANYIGHVERADGHRETIYLDAHYYYHYHHSFDYTYDIFAQWPLDEAAFYEEVERATGVFDNTIENETYEYQFMECKKGEYNCLILYSGDAPFNKATDNYSYIIFAYNEKDKTVRYIYCDSLENGADQPYYLQLDW